ncbi:MAG: dipeptidyl aminopeptidase/acylaminoacyl peptidase [Oceanicoccus sp.]|jgi:dipeptidyl aminopeptidase/acylaminoacyl peptidase
MNQKMHKALLTTLLVVNSFLVNQLAFSENTNTSNTSTLAQEIPPADTSIYAALPRMSQPKLSKDGKQMIAFKPINGTYHLYLFNLESKTSRLLMASDPDRFLFNWCNWANHERIVCSTRSSISWHRVAHKIFTTNLVAVNADGSHMMELIPPRKRSTAERPENSMIGTPETTDSLRNDKIVNYLPEDDQHILITLAREKWNMPTVYRLNVYNNKMAKIHRYSNNVYNWITDQSGRVRIGIGFKNGKATIKIRSKNQDTFHPLDLSQFDSEDLPIFQGFSDDGKTVYIATYNSEDKLALYSFDTETEALGAALARSEHYDVFNLIHDNKSGLIAASYMGTQRTYQWLNKTWEQRFNTFKSALPKNHQIKLVSSDELGEKLIFEVYGTAVNPTFYLFNTVESSIVSFGSLYRGLKNEQVAEKKAVSYKARDGLTIPAYLTLPADRNHPLPTIILPHGGPIARETDEFDYWSQFLSSRGYAVLQANFRGSSGYGRDFMAGGYQQWGQKMQDDIIDGLQWMIEEGIADPDNVCIVGGSYGGYAALVAAYQTPQHFKCAVSFAGVSDLRKTIMGLRQFVDRARATKRILNDVGGWSAVNDNSPIANVDKIALPLLLVHGDEDSRVAVKQSRDLAALLQQRKPKATFNYVEQKGGDHFLSQESQRLEFLTLMEDFLARYLK